MKALLAFVLLLALLTGCQSQPTYTDNGNPGQIKAVLFYDNNRNGVMDSGETGVQTKVGISQETSCPASNQDAVTNITTDVDGVALFKDLKPGKYCVVPYGNPAMTTKFTQEVYVSSDTITTVMFGMARE
jgi:hypothetical protein